jgi:hypothetical protein
MNTILQIDDTNIRGLEKENSNRPPRISLENPYHCRPLDVGESEVDPWYYRTLYWEERKAETRRSGSTGVAR